MLDIQIEEDPLLAVDRSDLEMVDCPSGMQFVRRGIVMNNSLAMDSGNAVHDALSAATRSYVSSRGALNAQEVSEELRQNLLFDTRPDLIHDAWKGADPSVRAWGYFLTKLHAENILRFDGGDGDKSGQLAIDFHDLGLRPTSEIDFLHAGPSPEVIHEIDYKSGWRRWTAEDVANAFQFRFHALLIMEAYPAIAAVDIRIWNTRFNDLTYGVRFRRDRDHEPLMMEVRRRAELFAKYREKDPDQCPANPDHYRCLRCPAVSMCVLSKHLATPIEDPERYLMETSAMEKAVDARKELLAEAVRRSGKDIVARDGTCFGLEKPKQTRKPSMALYTRKGTEAEEE